MDQRLRELERIAQLGDPADIVVYLHALIHVGQYSIEDVRILAWLRYPPAIQLLPGIYDKQRRLTKQEGRKALLAVVHRIILPVFAEPIGSRGAVNPQTLRELETIFIGLIENNYIFIKAPANSIQDIPADTFQRRAFSALLEGEAGSMIDSTSDSFALTLDIQDRGSLQSSMNLDQVSDRLKRVCRELIHSRASQFYCSPETNSQCQIDPSALKFGSLYLYTRPGWHTDQLISIERSNNELTVRFRPGYYPTRLSDIGTGGMFGEYRPIEALIPLLLPSAIRVSG